LIAHALGRTGLVAGVKPPRIGDFQTSAHSCSDFWVNSK
jgi:hypothetical protein